MTKLDNTHRPEDLEAWKDNATIVTPTQIDYLKDPAEFKDGYAAKIRSQIRDRYYQAIKDLLILEDLYERWNMHNKTAPLEMKNEELAEVVKEIQPEIQREIVRETVKEVKNPLGKRLDQMPGDYTPVFARHGLTSIAVMSSSDSLPDFPSANPRDEDEQIEWIEENEETLNRIRSGLADILRDRVSD